MLFSEDKLACSSLVLLRRDDGDIFDAEKFVVLRIVLSPTWRIFMCSRTILECRPGLPLKDTLSGHAVTPGLDFCEKGNWR